MSLTILSVTSVTSLSPVRVNNLNTQSLRSKLSCSELHILHSLLGLWDSQTFPDIHNDLLRFESIPLSHCPLDTLGHCPAPLVSAGPTKTTTLFQVGRDLGDLEVKSGTVQALYLQGQRSGDPEARWCTHPRDADGEIRWTQTARAIIE
ncbi:hypothetical protein RRG08_052369 [Elysia crispata]|uniref:Uncharacterized protein n=1 Tax=Elysia crispata TaxID=231223 RepID=A0AAE1A6G6_9GAST|nr:hypothetical protein RRG08_052369 [Elysia crispata]